MKWVFFISILFTAIAAGTSCSSPNTGTWTKSQLDSAVKFKIDSFAKEEVKVLDSLLMQEAAAIADSIVKNQVPYTSIRPGHIEKNRPQVEVFADTSLLEDIK